MCSTYMKANFTPAWIAVEVGAHDYAIAAL
jgi:hypothetical protein